MRGIPAPFPKAIGDNFVSRLFLSVNAFMITLFRGLFSYQIYVRAQARPTVPNLLVETIESSGELKRQVATA